MEPEAGVEPALSAPKADVLPLDDSGRSLVELIVSVKVADGLIRITLSEHYGIPFDDLSLRASIPITMKKVWQTEYAHSVPVRVVTGA